MYAIIEQGGKQYKVSKGDVINIELTDTAGGGSVEFGKVLMVSDGSDVKVGSPYLDGAKVLGRTAEGLVAGPKLYPTYLRRRKASKKKIGHRQKYLQVTVEEIVA